MTDRQATLLQRVRGVAKELPGEWSAEWGHAGKVVLTRSEDGLKMGVTLRPTERYPYRVRIEYQPPGGWEEAPPEYRRAHYQTSASLNRRPLLVANHVCRVLLSGATRAHAALTSGAHAPPTPRGHPRPLARPPAPARAPARTDHQSEPRDLSFARLCELLPDPLKVNIPGSEVQFGKTGSNVFGSVVWTEGIASFRVTSDSENALRLARCIATLCIE